MSQDSEQGAQVPSLRLVEAVRPVTPLVELEQRQFERIDSIRTLCATASAVTAAGRQRESGPSAS
jgi:hypothetical protein